MREERASGAGERREETARGGSGGGGREREIERERERQRQRPEIPISKAQLPPSVGPPVEFSAVDWGEIIVLNVTTPAR